MSGDSDGCGAGGGDCGFNDVVLIKMVKLFLTVLRSQIICPCQMNMCLGVCVYKTKYLRKII